MSSGLRPTGPAPEEVRQSNTSFYCYLGDWASGLLHLPVGVGLFIRLRAALARATTRFS